MLVKNEENKYSWVYEQPMLKSFFLLYEVWRVLLIAAAIIFVLMSIFNLINGDGINGILGALQISALVLGILLILSLPAYYLVTRANNNKYTVLFEMDENGIDHIQIKTDAAKALEALTMLAGVATRNRTTTAAGILSATGNSLYSDFSKVRKIKCDQDKDTIYLSSRLIRNQVYVQDEDFDFVADFIIEHCPDAKIFR